MTQSILVTGGAGFIGSNFVLHWDATEQGLVVNLDKLTYAGNLDNLRDAKRHHFVQGDINDGRLVRKLFRSEEHTSELQPHLNLVCRLLLEKKNKRSHIVGMMN